MGLGVRLWALLLWWGLGTALSTEDVVAQTLFRIGSGGVGGTYFPMANLIATAVSRSTGCAADATCVESGVLAMAQVSNGSVANVRDLGNRRLEAGLVQADVAYKAYRGQGDFVQEGSYEQLRVIANLYPETMHLVVSADSDIHTVADLAGHRVSLEGPGSGALVGAQFVIESYGLRDSDIEVVYVKPQLAAQAMRQGQLDAFFAIAGYPVAAIAELAVAHGIRLVPIHSPEAPWPWAKYSLILPLQRFPRASTRGYRRRRRWRLALSYWWTPSWMSNLFTASRVPFGARRRAKRCLKVTCRGNRFTWKMPSEI